MRSSGIAHWRFLRAIIRPWYSERRTLQSMMREPRSGDLGHRIKSHTPAVVRVFLGYIGNKFFPIVHTMNPMSPERGTREAQHGLRGDEEYAPVARAVAQARVGAARDERERLARELHDDVLQVLAGIALQVKALHRDESIEGLRRNRLAELYELIVDEQRRLRRLVESLGSPTVPAPSTGGDPGTRLASLEDRLAREWAIDVSIESALGCALTAKLEQELLYIVSEGVANAVRHGGASHIRVEAHTEDEVLHISITDDGTGFPFRGYYDRCALCRRAFGPRSLSVRVGALGGHLGIDSTDDGARVEIAIPLVSHGCDDKC